MKKLNTIALAASLLLAAACGQKGNEGKATAEGTLYGQEFKPEKTITVAQLPGVAKADKEEPVTVTGKVSSVCQAEGCWLELEKENGETVHVDAKDHSFKLPKDCSGKTAIVNGTVKVEETSVDELKHLAEDAGKPKEEIEKITEPKKDMVITATGIIIK